MSPSPSELEFAFDNTYFRELDGLYAPAMPAKVPLPRLLAVNESLGERLGLDVSSLSGKQALAIFAGNSVPEGGDPISLAYAGHQFGGFSPQLGDGRAILLGEVLDRSGRRRDVQLKGAGQTPFSRRGDGKSALGPVLREHLVSEAMHRLGVPTSRVLASVATGEVVRRERDQPGGVSVRVAASHLRIGTFEFFASRGEGEKVRRLLDYSLARHYPEALAAPNRALALLEAVCEAQAALVSHWMMVGFIHGVMNTDNMTISGETIDYGPCAFLEYYDPRTVYSSIDSHGRYAYGNQPGIASWNLARLAETLLPLVSETPESAVEQATEVLEDFGRRYNVHWLCGMRRKLGLLGEDEGDQTLAVDFLELLEAGRFDFTLGFRRLAEVLRGDEEAFLSLARADDAGWKNERWSSFEERWRTRSGRAADEQAADMDRANPIYVARNHRVEEALEAAVERDEIEPFEQLMDVLAAPFVERSEWGRYAEPAPADFGPYRTFCGT